MFSIVLGVFSHRGISRTNFTETIQYVFCLFMRIGDNHRKINNASLVFSGLRLGRCSGIQYLPNKYINRHFSSGVYLLNPWSLTPATLLHSHPSTWSHHVQHSFALHAFTCDLCLPTVWWSDWEKLCQYCRKKGEDEEGETEACRKCVASLVLCLQKPKTVFSLCRNPLWHQSMNKFSGVDENEWYLIKDDNWLDIWPDGQRLSSSVQVRPQLVQKTKYD